MKERTSWACDGCGLSFHDQDLKDVFKGQVHYQFCD